LTLENGANPASVMADHGARKVVGTGRLDGRLSRPVSQANQARPASGAEPRFSPGWTQTPDRGKTAVFVENTPTKTRGKYGKNVQSEDRSLSWIAVNAVTWKLTDGSRCRTPYCHGHWQGYESETAVGWAIDIAWPFGRAGWYARVGRWSFGPATLNEAKAAALEFLKNRIPDRTRNARPFVGPIGNSEVALLEAEGEP
jgi:hypothetical protein